MRAVKTYSRRPHHAMPLPDAEKLCRLCLEEPNEPTPIFTDTADVISLATRITFCVGLEMTQVDCLPNQICSNCYEELEQCYRFRKKCEISYQRLKLHLLAVMEQTMPEKNLHNQKENIIVSNSNQSNNDTINITENHINEDSENIFIEIHVNEDTKCVSNIEEMCYDDETTTKNVGENSFVLHSNQNSLVFEIDGTDLGLDFPHPSTSVLQPCMKSEPDESEPTLKSPTNQLLSQPIHSLPPLHSQPRPSLLLTQTTPEKCPPLQSQPSHLRTQLTVESEEILPNISSPKLHIQPNYVQTKLQIQPNSVQTKLQTQTTSVQNLQIKLPIAKEEQESVDWVLIDPPATQAQTKIRQPTLKLQPLKIPPRKSPTKTLQPTRDNRNQSKSHSNGNRNNENQTKSHSTDNQNQSLCNNVTISSFLENILTCVGALQQNRGFLALNGVTEVDLVMNEGTIVNMELVEEEEEVEAPCETVVKKSPLEAIVPRKEKAAYKLKHPPRPSCSICHMTFSTPSARGRHERDVHGQVRPHACTTCGAAFSQRCVLQRHLNTHMAIRPFACRKCPRTFAQRGTLDAHAKSHQPKWLRDLHIKKCTYDNCGKIFQHSSGLSRHMQWHEGRQYVCHACHVGLTDKSAFQRHLRSERHKRQAGNTAHRLIRSVVTA